MKIFKTLTARLIINLNILALSRIYLEWTLMKKFSCSKEPNFPDYATDLIWSLQVWKYKFRAIWICVGLLCFAIFLQPKLLDCQKNMCLVIYNFVSIFVTSFWNFFRKITFIILDNITIIANVLLCLISGDFFWYYACKASFCELL